MIPVCARVRHWRHDRRVRKPVLWSRDAHDALESGWSMIELAPSHKRGLAIANRVMLAAGSVGMGEATHTEFDADVCGAIVVGPLSQRSRAGSSAPRIAETTGGIVLETGGQNRGLDATIKHFGTLWRRSPVPVLVQLIDVAPQSLGACVSRLTELEGVGGVVWSPPSRMEVRTLRSAIEQMSMEGDLPLLVQLPLVRTLEWGGAAVEAGARALVIGAPPDAAAARRDAQGSQEIVTGALYGTAVFPLMLAALVGAAKAGWGVPLIASGGIHTAEQARTALAAGATAIQIDVAAWVEPTLPGAIAKVLSHP